MPARVLTLTCGTGANPGTEDGRPGRGHALEASPVAQAVKNLPAVQEPQV